MHFVDSGISNIESDFDSIQFKTPLFKQAKFSSFERYNNVLKQKFLRLMISNIAFEF